jgi:hypothetical protein
MCKFKLTYGFETLPLLSENVNIRNGRNRYTDCKTTILPPPPVYHCWETGQVGGVRSCGHRRSVALSFFFISSGVGLSPLYCGLFWPIVPAPDDRWGWMWSNWWNGNWQGKPKYSEKTRPSATLSTTNPTWPDPGSNPGRRDGKPVTNRLSYGAAILASVTYLLMELSPSGGAANSEATQEFPSIYGTRRFITVFTRALQRTKRRWVYNRS